MIPLMSRPWSMGLSIGALGLTGLLSFLWSRHWVPALSSPMTRTLSATKPTYSHSLLGFVLPDAWLMGVEVATG